MPKLIIDNIPVEVADGVTVLEAAQSVDIPIPHFCWHPALGKAGACRVCAVKMVDGPVKGIQMSCMLPAQDGMVVSTTDPEAVAMRRNVIEWLMINHPHDCPVCDEGGECQLQDYTIAGGHGIRRYSGTKRTHINQDLGPYIEHEMNRCIQCYRCVRFYQEYAGGTDFGVMGSAGRVYYGRFEDGQLESPFSGNLVDICPTGVFTDKTARFKARYWDYDMAPSVCPGCSLGCNTTPVARYRELLKMTARRNEAVNGWFICDRSRFANDAVNDPQRPRTPLIDGREASRDEALEALLLRIAQIEELYGSGSIAVVGSSRLALEGAALLPRLAECCSAGALCYFTSQEESDRTLPLIELLSSGKPASQRDVRESDCIVVCGCDPLQKAPMLALAVRQAWRNGAAVYVVPFGSAQGTEGVQKSTILQMNRWLSGVEASQEPKRLYDAISVHSLDAVPLADAKQPVLICSATNAPDRLAETLEQQSNLKLAVIFPAANSYVAAQLAGAHGAVSLEHAVATGKIKGIIAVEADIPPQLLEGIPFVAALDWRMTETVQAAQIVLPTTAWVEMDGTCINNEGRAQRFKKVMNPGVPVRGLDPAGHPPHIHRTIPPGGEPQPAWQTVAALIEGLCGEQITEPLSGKWERLQELAAESEGVMINDL
ncbi:MAG: NADH dehydrogenase (quinone) subunit G [Geobacteraceae bacterium GWC2_53_11]|nr:MAG: NADH dehydrogenase (quinone) subunit G [Geobacteraceae bacterium GWC2_53_11]